MLVRIPLGPQKPLSNLEGGLSMLRFDSKGKLDELGLELSL